MWDIKNLLKIIKKSNYRLKVEESFNYKKGLIIRHDVDWSIDDAYNFFLIEDDNEIKSTYYFRVSTDLYNIQSNKNKKILREIFNKNFEVGLHFDSSIYKKKDIKKNLIKEIDIIENIIGSKVNSYSDHMPRAHGIKKINLKGYKYAYDRIIFNKKFYISDSRFEYIKDLNKLISKSNIRKIYFLSHPEYYFNKKRSYNLISKRIIKFFEKQLINELSMNNSNYEKFK